MVNVLVCGGCGKEIDEDYECACPGNVTKDVLRAQVADLTREKEEAVRERDEAHERWAAEQRVSRLAESRLAEAERRRDAYFKVAEEIAEERDNARAEVEKKDKRIADDEAVIREMNIIHGAEVNSLRREVDRLKRDIADADNRTEDAEKELDGLRDAIEDDLPEYADGDDGGTANHRDRIEHAGVELKQLRREVEAAREQEAHWKKASIDIADAAKVERDTARARVEELEHQVKGWAANSVNRQMYDEATALFARADDEARRLRGREHLLERLLCRLVSSFGGETITARQAQLIVEANDAVNGPPVAAPTPPTPATNAGWSLDDMLGKDAPTPATGTTGEDKALVRKIIHSLRCARVQSHGSRECDCDARLHAPAPSPKPEVGE